MVTLGEFLRWVYYSVSAVYNRIARRVLRRDRLLLGSERRFRALMESAPDATVIVDWHGHIALVNAQAEQLFGYTRAELAGRHITDLIPRRYRATHRDHQKRYLRAPDARPMGSGLELFGLRKDGTEFRVEISLGPLETDQGVLVSSVIRDVTERKRIEAELVARAEALERSNSDLEQFAYVASHDLQAPLRVVSGCVELLERRYHGKLDEGADEYIDLAISGVERMQRLIEDLLSYSRVSQSEQPFEVVDFNVAVSTVLDELAGEIADRRADVRVGDLPTLAAEPTQIDQLFQNLISNAIKFTETEPVVEVSAQRENSNWRFAIADNGIGIPPEHRERIFKMFQRLHGHDQFPGTGIGLAICKRIVDHHGGELRVDDGQAGGTVMSFTIPEGDLP
jgi:PAS domain S-box-containing protein